MRKRLLVGVVVAAALMLVGGFAYAQATGDGTIKACAKSETGQLRLDTGNGCLPSESAVQWNQTGPAGPQGPSGVSTAIERYFFRGFKDPNNWLDVGFAQPGTNVLTVHLAAGNWVVSTQVLGADYDGHGVLVCINGNNDLGGFAVGQGSIGNTLQQLNLSFQGTFAVPAAGGDLALSCWLPPDPADPDHAGHPRIGYADVVATKVDSLG